MNRIIRFVAYILILLMVAPGALFAEPEGHPRRVLVVHPSLETIEWVLDFNNALFRIMTKSGEPETELYFRYLGTELRPDLISMEDIVNDLRFMESTLVPDIVIAVFPSVHSLIAENRESIFKDTVKIFIPVISSYEDTLKSLPNSYIIGSASEYAMNTTLDRICTLLPDLENLLVCVGSSPENIPYLKVFQNIVGNYTGEFKTQYIIGPPLEELFRKVSTMPPDSAILVLPINKDNDQVLYTTESIFPKFSQIANAPVFAFGDSLFGQGIVGGNLTSAKAYGEYAGDVALKIFKDKNYKLNENDIITREMYDWREMKRWKISRKRLPEQAEIFFREESFIEKYTSQLLLALGIVLFQLFLIFSLFIQLKKRRKTQSQLKKSLTEKEILLREIHHRVKNNLAIISSFLALQSINIKDREIQGLFISSQNRIRSMALIHELLYKEKNLEIIDIKEYLSQLINQIIYSYYEESHKIKLDMDIGTIQINFDVLISLGLLINEIVSNSMKYAFSDVTTPALKVRLQQNESLIELNIKDNGPGIPEGIDTDKQGSIGTLLIHALVEQITGELNMSSDNGTCYTITFPAVP